MTALVSIGAFNFPDPSFYDANTATIVNSGRNTEGYMIGEVIRENVAKVSLKWRYISVTDWANILKKFSSAHGGSFIQNVTFFNQTVGTWETRKMYVSDRSAGIFRRDPDTELPMGYTNASLSLIEV
jgi:hypothetical protein